MSIYLTCFHRRCSSTRTVPGPNTPPWRWIPRAPLTLTYSWTPPNRTSTCYLTKRYERQIVSFQPAACETNAATHDLSEDYTFALTNIARMTVALQMKVYSWAVCFMRWIIASGIVLTANQNRRISACKSCVRLRLSVCKARKMLRACVVCAFQVTKLNVAQCEKHLDCRSCLSNRDPYCGWCLLEGR